MKVLPFEEAYYGVGANDIRAWQARTLGPGSYLATEKYPNSVGISNWREILNTVSS